MNCRAPAMDPKSIADNVAGTSARMLEQQLLHQAIELQGGKLQLDWLIPDMHCVGCISKIENALSKLPAITRARANLSLRKVSVIWDPKIGPALDQDRIFDELGFEHSVYDLRDSGDKEYKQRGQRLLLSLGVAGFAAANIMLLSVSVWSGAEADTARLFHLISGMIAVPAIFYAGRPFFASACNALRVGRLNMDVPISLAVLLALGMSIHESLVGGQQAYFDAAVTLLFFLLVGRYLDHVIRGRAREAVQHLTGITSRGATRIMPDGETIYVPLEEIDCDMSLRILAGERFPVNVRLCSESAEIDRSIVTGESQTVTMHAGELIEAGALNLSAPVMVEALGSADESFLAEIQKMIEAAENGRSEYVRIADRAAQIYAPAVHLLAAIAFVVWLYITKGNFNLSINIAISVLIITCPCALGLAVPVAHVVGASRLLRKGVLMRDGSALERMAEADCVVFDKTGTITTGNPMVEVVDSLSGLQRRIIRTLSSSSYHPLSKAISRYFIDTEEIELSKVTEVPGFGVEGIANKQKVRLGNPEWVGKIAKEDTGPSNLTNCQVAFAKEGDRLIRFRMFDVPRPESTETIQMFAKAGLGSEILSGDSLSEVKRIADLVGVEKYRSEKSPSDKIQRLQSLKQEGRRSIMAGDGLNDAPALAAGHVSVAPASACDVGRHAADFIFTGTGLGSIFDVWRISRETALVVKQNFIIAAVYNCLAIPFAMAGYVTPLIAALAMSASSLLVIANSFRPFLKESLLEPDQQSRARQEIGPEERYAA